LGFTNAYQYAQIPAIAEYESEGATIAGWVFSKRSAYDGDGVYLLGDRGSLRLQVMGDLSIRAGRLNSGISIAPHTWQYLSYELL